MKARLKHCFKAIINVLIALQNKTKKERASKSTKLRCKINAVGKPRRWHKMISEHRNNDQTQVKL